MGVYGYCVVRGGHAPPEALVGVSSADVALQPVDGLGVWVSWIERPEPTLEHIQAHNRVIEAAVSEEVTPVPLRFGQWSESAETFEKVVREKAGWYEERLVAFAGAMEFGLRVVRPDMPERARVVRVPPATSGTAYMKALRDNVAAARGQRVDEERMRAVLAEVMGEIVREERIEAAHTPHGVVTVSHLVRREQFDEYGARTEVLRDRLPEMRFLLSGPWVPYSFAV